MPISGYFDIPFASSGTRATVPDAVQSDGSVSYTQGYGVDYTLDPASNPSALDIEQNKFNQLMYDVTSAIQNWQQNTVAPFITTAMNGGSVPYSYPQYAEVLSGGITYQSLVGTNTDTPTTANTTKWLVKTPNACGLVGDARNLRVAYASSTTLTCTADEIICETALGGTSIKAASLNVTLNTANTGANGMDTGSAPTSAALYLYAITGPQVNPAVLATAVGTGASIYPGSHMPAGYNASALIGIYLMDGSGHFSLLQQVGRTINLSSIVTIFSGTVSSGSLASQSLSAAVPVGAKYVNLSIQTNSVPAGNSFILVTADTAGATGSASQSSSLATTGAIANLLLDSNIQDMPILTSQTIYWQNQSTTAQNNLYVRGYSF